MYITYLGYPSTSYTFLFSRLVLTLIRIRVRFEGGEGNRRQRQRRQRGWDEDRGPSRRKFDVGSFLRSGPLNIMQPGAGMEQKAAQ